MGLFKWSQGRQELCEYEKLKLWSFKLWKFGFDCYVLKYKPNTLLPWHKDQVPDGRHWRLNIALKGSATFIMRDDNMFYSYFSPVFILFRPDIYKHMLQIHDQTHVKLSFGFARYK